ncbi:MAG: vWA domain-containing protein [Chthonomonadales bacterium]
MGLDAPLKMLWLLPAASLIIAMYLLKLRRRDVVVPSTLLWQRVIRDVQANAPFQRLRRNILLILQILAALILSVALAQPYVRRIGHAGRSVVLILDTSASMEATDVRPDRMAKAQDLARGVVASMAPQDLGMVIAAGARPEALTGFTDRRSELAQAVSQIHARTTSCDMKGALGLAAAVVAPASEGEIHIFSDGGFTQITGVNLGHAHVFFHRVGRASHNIGIVAADYRRTLSQEGIVEVLATLHNFDSHPQTFTMEIRGRPSTPGAQAGSTLMDAREVSLPPNAERSEVFQIPEPPAPLQITINLDVQDDLAADNRAYLIIPPRKKIRALLVGRGDIFLEEGIQADASVELSQMPLAEFAAPTGYDVVLFDGACPRTLPPGNYVFVNCTADRAPVRNTGVVRDQAIIVPDMPHPILRYVDLTQIRWSSMSAGQPQGSAQEIAACAGGSVIVAAETGSFRTVWLGFSLDLAHGPFPLTVSYPIFLSNLLRWTAHAEDHTSQIRTGAPVILPAPAGASQLTVTKPDGTQHILQTPSGGVAAFNDTDEAGIYTVRGPQGHTSTFAANLMDYNEEDLAPRNPVLPSLSHTGSAGTASVHARRAAIRYELGPVLAAGLLGVLLLEWWLYHRRIHLV